MVEIVSDDSDNEGGINIDFDKVRSDIEACGLNKEVVANIVTHVAQKGHITFTEVNNLLPNDKNISEKFDDILELLSSLDLKVIDDDEIDDVEDIVESTEKQSQKGDDPYSDDKDDEEEDETSVSGRTDDPVRLYLREMGSVELLSREGEIAIAKRIEAGRELMLKGICESPLTYELIVGWVECPSEFGFSALLNFPSAPDMRSPPPAAHPNGVPLWL